MICPDCKTEVADGSKFCSSCGRPLKEEGIDMILPPEGSHTESRALLYLMFAIMCLFFGIFLLIPGYFIGIGLIIPSLLVVVLGVVLLIARYYVLWSYARKVERMRKESSIRVRCRYCHALNTQESQKCHSCGAPLI